MRTRTLLRGGLAATVAAVLMSTVQSSQADDPEWYPGLPDTTFGVWTNAAQGGASYAKRAKQWFRSPQGMTVAEVVVGNTPATGDGYVRAEAYVVSPKGAPANYGYLAPMTVRSVGFGLMPVEATVQVSQRFVDGYPQPLAAFISSHETTFPASEAGPVRKQIRYFSTTIKDSLNIQILSVRVDGVDLELNGDCRTVEPAPFTASTPDYTIEDGGKKPEWYRSHDKSEYWNPVYGGQFSGTMTIPPFTGCTTTAGDDLSDLLTLSASGPDNPIIARSGWPCVFGKDGISAPVPPGASSPRLASEAGGAHDPDDKGLKPGSGCPGVEPFEYPDREDR